MTTIWTDGADKICYEEGMYRFIYPRGVSGDYTEDQIISWIVTFNGLRCDPYGWFRAIPACIDHIGPERVAVAVLEGL